MKKNINQKANRLINEKNPYLLQHAYNPVEWFPWSDEAFEVAKTEDKLIFLSIGYSTCHWCHVMAHESFEDEDVAQMMNEAFINIKVDREERPDIDSIYMQVCQMMTGSGGWPLTIIMTPEKKPVFAGTYFPKETVYNRIGMNELIPRIKEAWDTRKEDILLSANDILEKIQEHHTTKMSYDLGNEVLGRAYDMLKENYDDECGGFGSHPKFPVPHNLRFLMSYFSKTKNQNALDMVNKTLISMGMGGIYDQIGFGFHRYSTDRLWLVPHFEKMLYDQAQLVMAYTEAWQLTNNPEFKIKVYEILSYVSRELTSPDGGFYCAEDADSEGVEGKFYFWTYDELKDISDSDFEIVKNVFSLKIDGNFRDERTGKNNGNNILHNSKPINLIAEELGMDSNNLSNRIDAIKQKLFNHREKRIHPFKDEKILTDWNGLMISAYAKAGKIFNEQGFIEKAIKAHSFINKNMKHENGLLSHSFQKTIPGNLDDYAFYTWGLLELYNSTFDINFLKEAVAMQDILIKHFWDTSTGGFYFTADFAEDLIIRKKEIYDGAIPSGNSVQLSNLIRISKLTGNVKYNEYIEKLVYEFSNQVNSHPVAYTHFLYALSSYIYPSVEIVIVGKSRKDIEPFLEILRNHDHSNICILVKTDDNSGELTALAPYTKDMKMLEDKTTVYICRNFTCDNPINDSLVFAEKLQSFFKS